MKGILKPFGYGRKNRNSFFGSQNKTKNTENTGENTNLQKRNTAEVIIERSFNINGSVRLTTTTPEAHTSLPHKKNKPSDSKLSTAVMASSDSLGSLTESIVDFDAQDAKNKVLEFPFSLPNSPSQNLIISINSLEINQELALNKVSPVDLLNVQIFIFEYLWGNAETKQHCAEIFFNAKEKIDIRVNVYYLNVFFVAMLANLTTEHAKILLSEKSNKFMPEYLRFIQDNLHFDRGFDVIDYITKVMQGEQNVGADFSDVLNMEQIKINYLYYALCNSHDFFVFIFTDAAVLSIVNYEKIFNAIVGFSTVELTHDQNLLAVQIQQEASLFNSLCSFIMLNNDKQVHDIKLAYNALFTIVQRVCTFDRLVAQYKVIESLCDVLLQNKIGRTLLCNATEFHKLTNLFNEQQKIKFLEKIMGLFPVVSVGNKSCVNLNMYNQLSHELRKRNFLGLNDLINFAILLLDTQFIKELYLNPEHGLKKDFIGRLSNLCAWEVNQRLNCLSVSSSSVSPSPLLAM